MKRYSTALLFGLLSLSSQLAHADVIDDAIGNIQQAINDAITPAAAAATMMTIVMTMTVALIAVSMTTAVGSLKTDAAV